MLKLKGFLAGLSRQFRYFFDNSLSRRGAFFLWMTLAVLAGALVIALTGAVVRAIPALSVEVSGSSNAFEDFWLSLGRMLSLGSALTIADRIMAIIYWFAGLTVMGSIFAFRAAALTKTMERLKAAPSPILDSGHTLILGWSPRVFTIVSELAIANENVKKPLVVIFANVDRAVMDAELALRSKDLGNLRVITRKGDTTSPADLVRANVSGARSVIVLDADRSGDAMVVSTVLAARAVSQNPNQRFIVEVDDANIAEALRVSTQGQVIPVIPKDVISRVTAQASRQPGIPAVILELLDFDGDEIYFARVPELTGKTYFEAQVSFEKSAVIGIKPEGSNVVLNPSHDYKILATDQIVAISEDDDQVIYKSGLKKPARPSSVIQQRAAAAPRNLLLIGWSEMGARVLTELADFSPKGSTVDVVSQSRFVEDDLGQNTKFGNLKVQHHLATGKFEQLQQMVQAKRYDEVLVLGYRGKNISEAEADGQTLLATMQLARLFESELKTGTAPRLVAEILDPLKAKLASTASIDDLVVSENLAALLVSQLSENPSLASIFEDLFTPARGAAVHVRLMSEYVSLGQEVSFADLVAAASARGESAIGWRVLSNNGIHREVVVNPAKDQAIVPTDQDGLIVIGKSF